MELEYGQGADYAIGFQGEAPTLSQEDIAALRELTYEDPVEFLKTFFPTKFPKAIPWVHRGIAAIVTGRTDFLIKYGEMDKIIKHFRWSEDPSDPKAPTHPIFSIVYDAAGVAIGVDMYKAKYTEIIMPRGFSKTTLVGIGLVTYKVVFKENNFIVYLSETATHAETQLGNVKLELATNPLIQICFGNLKPDRTHEFKWTAGFFQAMNGVIVAAKGRGGQVRGLNVNAQRPDCILFDDVEDKESVKTEEQRLKCREWFYADVKPALPEMDENATIIGLGTVLHQEALLMVLERDPEWTTVKFGAIDLDGDPLWADNLTLEKLELKKKSYALAGMLSSYYMEYLSQLRNDETALFKPALLRPEWLGELDARALACDPAISEKKGADFFALGAVGMTTRGYLLVLDVLMKKGVPPAEQVDLFYSMSEQWDINHHGVEAIAYQKALIHLIRGEMFRRKRYFVIQEIRHGTTGKDERIKGILQPRYANGYIGHLRRFPDYETQLLDYPNGKKDGPDVVAMAITLLDPYAANLADPDDNAIEKDEYEPHGNWRQY